MEQIRFKAPINLSVVIVVLATIASVGGLFLGGLYRDNTLITAAWHGNDFVTLILAIPSMVISMIYSIRGSQRALLIWMGTLWYMVYNYMFYLFGAAFNNFFLVYVVIFTVSIYALILIIIKIDVKKINCNYNRIPVKWVSGFMIFFAVLMGGMWIALSLSFVLTGVVPLAITQTGHPTGVVFAIDLSLIVPALVVCAVMLYKRKVWGYILATIVMLKASTYGLAMIAMSVFAYFELGVWDSLIPLWGFLTIGCFVSCGFLLKGSVKQ